MMAPVQVGSPAPTFSCTAVVDGRLKEVSLKSYTDANHWVILLFFPQAWSFICPTEVKAFSARLEEFLYTRACAVLFASTDNAHALKAWNATPEDEGGLGGVHVPLLSDCSHALSRAYGVLDEAEGLAQRALFIIDPRGKIRASTVYDADVGRSVDETQRLLDALKFRDEYGEGCGVDWKVGDKGIDIVTKGRVEGSIDVGPKVGWKDWALPSIARTVSNYGSPPPANGNGYSQPRKTSSDSSQAEIDRAYHAELVAGRTSGLISPGAMSPMIRTPGSRKDSASDGTPGASYFKLTAIKNQQQQNQQNPHHQSVGV